MRPGCSGSARLRSRIPPVVFENAIARSPLEQAVISRADKFCDNENLNFKFETQSVPHQSEKRVGPMMRDGVTSEAMHEPLEQPRMFSLFIDE